MLSLHLNISFTKQKLSSLMKFPLLVVGIISCETGVLFRKSILFPFWCCPCYFHFNSSEYWIFDPVQLIFLCVAMQFYHHHCLLKRLFQCIFFNMFSKVRCLHVFTFGLTLILHWSPCLFRAGTLLCHGSVIKFATGYADSSSIMLLFNGALTIKVFCASLWVLRWFFFFCL